MCNWEKAPVIHLAVTRTNPVTSSPWTVVTVPGPMGTGRRRIERLLLGYLLIVIHRNI